MTAPLASPAARRLYDALGPLGQGDEGTGWVLAKLCNAVTLAVADVEALAADVVDPVTGAVDPGWSPLLDVARTPARALPWLGQWVGAVVTPGLSDDQARALVAAAPGRRRGSPGAIADAARLWLSGTKQVTLVERVGGDAYALEVQVYAAQVVDLAQLTAALHAALPAGLSLTVTVVPGWSVAQMEAAIGTVAALEADVSTDTVSELETHLP